MGQLRTANKRRNRALLRDRATATPTATPGVAAVPADADAKAVNA